MKWEVTGADMQTGTERAVVVEAKDATEAELLAHSNGLLVASSRRADLVSKLQGGPPVATLEYRGTPAQRLPDGPVDRRIDGALPRPTEPLSASRLEEGRMTTGEKVVYGIFGVVGGLAVFGNTVAAIWWPTTHHADRFLPDNAMGATANAAERVADALRDGLDRQRSELWIVIGMLMLVVASLIRLRAALRRLAK